MAPKFISPCRITKKLSEVVYELQDVHGNNKISRVHISDLKPYFSPNINVSPPTGSNTPNVGHNVHKGKRSRKMSAAKERRTPQEVEPDSPRRHSYNLRNRRELGRGRHKGNSRSSRQSVVHGRTTEATLPQLQPTTSCNPLSPIIDNNPSSATLRAPCHNTGASCCSHAPATNISD